MLAILDYEAGNQTSVQLALTSLGIESRITADPEQLFAASGVIFPGVGAARQAMNLLERTGLDTVLRRLVAAKRPLLGVCLGCQILLEHSDENDTRTLGIVKGSCKRFPPDLRDESGDLINIPHMGWNGYSLKKESVLFSGIPKNAEFYYVHGYYVDPEEDLVIATSHHGMDFCAAYGRDGFWAVQFHPEKSGKSGLRLLKNFYDYCRQIDPMP